MTAYFSKLTTLQKLNLQADPMTAPTALIHLQQLTRLTSLRLSGRDPWEWDPEDAAHRHVLHNAWTLNFSVESCEVW